MQQDRVRVQINADGTQTLRRDSDGATVNLRLSDAIEADIQEVEMNAAQKRLARLKATTHHVETVAVEGETFFIKRLSWPEISRVKLNASRGDNGQLDLASSATDLRRFTIAVLEAAVVVSDEPNAEQYFAWGDAVAYVDSANAEIIQIVDKLFNRAVKATPELSPKVLGAAIPPLHSTKPMFNSGEISSSKTPSSETPSTSPNGATNLKSIGKAKKKPSAK